MKRLYTAILTAALLLTACGTPAPASAQSGGSTTQTPPASASAESVAPAPSDMPTAADMETDGVPMTIASMKGPTTMGLVKLMDDADKGIARYDYQVTMYGTADEFSAQLVKGDIDIALIPANLASVLYNKTEGRLSVAAINTLGVLYVVETGDSIKSVADLKGKTIYSTGKGTTPEFVLNHVLEGNGLEADKDVTVTFKAEATEVAAAMQASSGYPIALLPQPYVTTLQQQMPNLRIALDLTEEWNKVSPESGLVTGVVVAQKALIEEDPQAFQQFLDDYQASTVWVNENPDIAAELIAGYGIVPKAEIAKAALPYCNITFVAGADMKAKLSGYLQVLFAQNPQAVGGKLPEDGFYYDAA